MGSAALGGQRGQSPPVQTEKSETQNENIIIASFFFFKKEVIIKCLSYLNISQKKVTKQMLDKKPA